LLRLWRFLTQRTISWWFFQVKLRMEGDNPFVTDNSNYIIELYFKVLTWIPCLWGSLAHVDLKDWHHWIWSLLGLSLPPTSSFYGLINQYSCEQPGWHPLHRWFFDKGSTTLHTLLSNSLSMLEFLGDNPWSKISFYRSQLRMQRLQPTPYRQYLG